MLLRLCFLLLTDDPATVGQWTGPDPWPVVTVHSVVLHSNKILQWGRPVQDAGAEAWLTDLGTFSHTNKNPGQNLFCGGHSFLADGRLITTGGTFLNQAKGIPDTWLFDPVNETWEKVQDMAVGRWYPSNVMLGDGRVLTMSGLDIFGEMTDLVEIFTVGQGWQLLNGAERMTEMYPFLHLMPDGKLFHAGPEVETELLDVGSATWTHLADTNSSWRYEGTSVLLPGTPTRVMILGGTSDAVTEHATCEIIDLADPTPQWQYTAAMHFGRVFLNAVLLPDGTVLVVGGGPFTQSGCISTEGAVLEAELYDPATETWTVMAPMTQPRLYHSTANLLPDGRVISSGMDCNLTAEVFSPPYLFRGSRPVIQSAPSIARHGDRLAVQYSAEHPIAKAALLRPTAATHAQSFDQRYVALDLEIKSGSILDVTVPSNPNECPPGHYMLFLVDDQGVPAVATFVRIDLPGTSAVCTQYGTGVAGSGDVVPELLGSGVPELGAKIHVTLTDALGGTLGILLLALAEDHVPLFGGELLVGDIFNVLTVHLSGPGQNPGAGAILMPTTVVDDPLLANATFYLQAFALDAGASAGLSVTNGVRIHTGQ